jgi:hypothetical protein
MPEEPRPQTDHTQAIEAAAQAMHAYHYSLMDLTTLWNATNDAERDHWRDQAGAAYDAMAPLIRRAVAEEIARREIGERHA